MIDEEAIGRLRESLSDALLSEREIDDVISSVMTGRPLLLLGPMGAPKDMVATIILEALGLEIHTVNSSASLRSEDLFGEVDPVALRQFGWSDRRSFIPGVVHKAKDQALLIKDLDNTPDKVAEALANYLDDRMVMVGNRAESVDVTIVALASKVDVDERLVDRFSVVHLGYPEDSEREEAFIARRASCRWEPPDWALKIASSFLKRSRNHPDLESGASTRSGIRFVEDVCACAELSGREPDETDLYNSAYAAFGHAINPNPFSWKTNRELAKGIFQEAVLATRSSPPKPPSKSRFAAVGRYKLPIIATLLVALVAVGSFIMMSNKAPPPVDQPTIPGKNTTDPAYGPPVNSTPDGYEPVVDPEIPAIVISTLGNESLNVYYNDETGDMMFNGSRGSITIPDPDEEPDGSIPIPGPGDPQRPSIFTDFPPALLIGSFIAIAFLSTFLFDYLDFGRKIRDSKFMENLRKNLGISWEPLTRLYHNIAEDVSPISRRLEGDALGQTVREISAARDELYAERARDRATLKDIAELARKKPERYRTLSGLLAESTDPESTIPPETQLIRDLERHLKREGLIKGKGDLSFTHRVSKFLVSDVDERILRRVYDALQGVAYEELPPLPSSDVKDVRKYRRGDSYKDIAIRESIRDAIRRNSPGVEAGNLHVYERECERREVVVQGDADIVVVLDLSGSMAYSDKLWYAKQAIVVMTIIAERYGNRVGVVGFRDLSTEVAELGADRNTAIAKVANLLPRGGTNIAAGIRRSIDLLVGEVDVRKGEQPDPSMHPERRKQIILLTDGDATHPKPKQFAAEYARRCARLAKRYGIMISVVCIGREDDESEFGHSYNPELAQQISEIGEGSLFFVKDMRDLSGIFVAEVDKLMYRAAQPTPLVRTA